MLDVGELFIKRRFLGLVERYELMVPVDVLMDRLTFGNVKQGCLQGL